MKKTYFLIALTIVISVFMLCFFFGRAIVLNDKKELKAENKDDGGAVEIPYQEKESKEVAVKEDFVPKDDVGVKEEKLADISKKAPDRMKFPCGDKVLRSYSQIAIYSKTTDDWRAHFGIDYSAPIGSDVISVYSGVVLNVYKDKLWGNCIEVLHTGNVIAIYRNLADDISVQKDDVVEEGQVIGRVGKSASVESKEEDHLHFEIWMDGQPINPESFIY